jgi:hypothetical protein
MIRDRKVKVISTRVAEKTVCACVGRSNSLARAHLDRGGDVG